VILVEVVQLIIEVDWGGNSFIHCEAHCTGGPDGALIIVSDGDLLDLVTHYVEHYSESEEDQPED
jgi:hypothetical protein